MSRTDFSVTVEDVIKIKLDNIQIVTKIVTDGKTIIQRSPDGELSVIGVSNGNGDILSYDDIKKAIDKQYSKAYVFDTYADFSNWINGSYLRPDGAKISDLALGDEIWIKTTGVPDYWYSDDKTKPVTLANFSKLEADDQEQNYVIVANQNEFYELKPFDGLKVYITETQTELTYTGGQWVQNNSYSIEDKEKVEMLSNSGDGAKALFDDGQYKEVDTSNFVDLTSAQKIDGAKTFKQILLAQTEWTEPVTTFSKSTNYVFPNDAIYIKVDPSNPDNKDTMPVRFVCGNNGLFCIIAKDGSMIADYTGQTPLGTSAIYRMAFGSGDRLYVTGRNGIFWINIDTFDFNNPVWSELKTGITGYVYAVENYSGEVNGVYGSYMLFGTGRNVIMYNEYTDTWGSSISLGVTSGYAEFFLPYWKDDEQVYFFFARNVFGYFNPRTGAIVKNTDYTISGTAYTYYLDGNLVYLQDSNKTIGIYDLDTMTRVKSSELGNVSWSGYIYTIQQNYDGNLIIGGANSNIVIIDKDTFEAKEVFELKYGSLTNFAFNWNGDWYYVTDTAISSPSNVQKDILNFIPAGTRVAEFTLLNENWVEEVDEKTGDKIYYYNLSLGSLGKTNANHATVGLAHSLIGLEAYENTQKIINANIFSTYDFGSNIRLYAKDIDTSDVGNSMIITVEVYE